MCYVSNINVQKVSPSSQEQLNIYSSKQDKYNGWTNSVDPEQTCLVLLSEEDLHIYFLQYIDQYL